MSEAIEAMERAEKVEHTAHGEHAGHHGGGNSKLIGLTMGLIGVLIALCAALVGGERNEMSRAMIEQTQATADATSASTKFRIVMISIEQLRAQPPEALAGGVRERFVRLYDDYLKERKYTADWAASYRALIDAHFAAAESYEHAQVVAEIGIVLASLAVLLGSRAAWLGSMVLAAGAIGWVGTTYLEMRGAVGPAETAIEQQGEAYQALRRAHVGDHSDADAADALDPGGAIRRQIEAQAQAAAETAGEAGKAGE